MGGTTFNAGDYSGGVDPGTPMDNEPRFKGPIIYPEMEVKNKKTPKTVKDLPPDHYGKSPVSIYDLEEPDARSSRKNNYRK